MKLTKAILSLIAILVIGTSSLVAQTINGNSQVGVSTTHTYSYSGSYSSGYRWVVIGGTISGSSTGLSVTVNWSSSAGSGTVQFYPSAFSFNPYDLSVTKYTNPPMPSTPTVSSNTCGNKTVTRGTPPLGITWFWQTSSSGTSMGNANETYAKTSTGYVYLRARRNSTGQWSSARSVYVTVNAYPSQPSAPSVSSNTCGNKTITRGTPPSGITWFWQTSSTGTSMSNSNEDYVKTSSGNVYLRARNNSSGCWSSARTVSVTVNAIPPQPPTLNISSNTCGSKTATRPNISGYYWQNSSTGTSTSNSDLTINIHSSKWVHLRYRSSAGCWSTARSAYVTVNPTPGTPSVPSVSSNTCGNKTITRGTPPSGITWFWQTSSTGTSMSNSNEDYVKASSGNVYLRAQNNSSGCWSSNSRTVSVTVNQAPAAPTVAGTSRCGTGNATLVVDGYALSQIAPFKWYTSSSGGSPIASGVSSITQNVSSTTNYYVSQYDENTSCESTRTQATITVQAPSHTIGSAESHCETNAFVPLTGEPVAGGTWSINGPASALVLGNGLDMTELTPGQTYQATYTYSTGACASSNTFKKDFYVEPVSLPGTITGPSVRCGSGSSTFTLSGHTGTVLKWESRYHDGGSWSGLDLITDTENTLSVSPTLTEWTGGTRTYEIIATVQSGSCLVVTATHQITIDRVSVGGLVAGTTEEFGVASGNLTLSGETGVIQRWEQSTDGGSNWTTISHTTGVLPYTNVQQSTLYRAVVQSGTCGETTSANAEITILNVPSVDLGLTQNIRPGQSTILTATAGHASYQWYKDDVALTGETSNQITVAKPGAYKVAVTSSGGATYTTGNAIIASQMGMDENAVITYNYRVPIDNIVDPFDHTSDVQNVNAQVFDGLGRAIQQVSMEASPAYEDLVQPVEYDDYGRQIKSYLPYKDASSSSLYKPTALADQPVYYNGTYSDPNAYAETKFEPSMLNRVVEQGNPGTDWQLGTNNTVTTEYGFNSATDVIIWKFESILTDTETKYAADLIYKTTTNDEDGNETITFTDKEGRTILKKSQVDASTWADTYYIYDLRGNLRVVLPPEAVSQLSTEFFAPGKDRQAFLDLWAFQYRYDGRSRMIKKKVPGADSVVMVYDKWDRLVLTQDGVQRDNNEWMFTKYDAFNRPVMTGIATITGTNKQVRDAVYASVQRAESFDAAGTNEYSNQTYPTTGIDEYLTVTYYDNYDWDNSSVAYTNPAGLVQNTAVVGQVTGTLTKTGSGSWIASASYYDDKYRVIQAVSTNHLGGTDVVTNHYDFIGQVTKSISSHNNGASTTDITRTFTYDHMGRLEKTYHQMTQDVQWTDLVGVVVSNNQLTKTAPLGWGNGGAASTQKIAAGNDGAIEFTAQTNHHLLVGLSETNADAHYNTIGYTFNIEPSWNVKIYENGANRGLFGTYTIGDVFKVERVGSTILYKKNGTVLYTSTVTTDAALIGDVCIQYENHAIVGTRMIFDDVLLAKNTYDDLGQLELKNLHYDGSHPEPVEGDFQQSVDYTYNIRGWLRKINDPVLTGGDLFGMELYYTSNPYVANPTVENDGINYDGNISAMEWSDFSYQTSATKGYAFKYDKLSRLKDADHYNGGGTSNFDVNTISYDLNGNLLSLTRNGANGSPIDILDYHEADYVGNQLMKVTDSSGDDQGFDNATSGTGNDYTYDANGNMTSDANKGITAIDYNHLNLPTKVTFDAQNYIEYLYDAAGIKLQQKVWQDDTLRKITDYVGEFIYEDGNLQLMQHEEGRIVPLTLEEVPVDSTSVELTLTLDGNANDESGNGRNGTVNGATLATGKNGDANSAYQFDGVDDYIDLSAHDTYFNSLTKGTLSIWFKTSVSGRMSLLGRGVTSQDWMSIDVGGNTHNSYSDESLMVALRVNDSYTFVGYVRNGTDYYNDGVWHNLVVIVDDTSNKIYIDGKQQAVTYSWGSASGSGNFLNVSSGQFTLGKRPYPGSPNSFDGSLDEFNVFSRALSGAEVQALYTGSKPGEVQRLITGYDYQYHLKDHLGNVRVTFSSQAPEGYTTLASMENSNEAEYFNNYVATSISVAGEAHSGTHVSRNSNLANDGLDLNTFLCVNKGDTIKSSAYAYYSDLGSSYDLVSSTIASALFTSAFNADKVAEGVNAAQTNFNAAFLAGTPMGGRPQTTTAPPAFINYIFFDMDMNYVTGGFKQITTASNGTSAQVVVDDFIPDRDGYLMVYLSNETDGAELIVSWDDFTIYNGKTNVVSTQDYYPFGLTFNESVRVASKKNNFLYNQGTGDKTFLTERVSDLGLNWDMTKYRMYDYSIGRFLQVDPLADAVDQERWTVYHFALNNPVRYNDPYGDCTDPNDPNCSGKAAVTSVDGSLEGAPGGTSAAQFRDDNVTISPVENPVISSDVGPRDAPLAGASTDHPGTDIVQKEQGAVEGQDVVAAQNSTVISVKSDADGNGAGNRVWLKNNSDGNASGYFHLQDDNFGGGLKPGDKVSRGTKIGQVGNTGNSDGAHLHYEIRNKPAGSVIYNPRNKNSGLRNAPTVEQARKPAVVSTPAAVGAGLVGFKLFK